MALGIKNNFLSSETDYISTNKYSLPQVGFSGFVAHFIDIERNSSAQYCGVRGVGSAVRDVCSIVWSAARSTRSSAFSECSPRCSCCTGCSPQRSCATCSVSGARLWAAVAIRPPATRARCFPCRSCSLCSASRSCHICSPAFGGLRCCFWTWGAPQDPTMLFKT